jgi:hypothetical protein
MFLWHIGPLHMAKRIILSYNVVTEIKQILTRVIIDTPIMICGDMSSIITYCTSSVQITYQPIQYVHLNTFPVW